MSDLKFSDLSEQYEDFQYPLIKLIIDGTELDEEQPLLVTAIDVEQTCGFEAGIATVTLVGPYNPDNRVFNIDKVKQFLYLGSTIIIYAGYSTTAREIFRGFIARVHFVIPPPYVDSLPSVELTCMDAKGLMMANRRSRRLKAKSYSEAVKEILNENVFLTQKDDKQQDFTTINVTDTPDKQEAENEQGTTDRRVEMVEESDYEFIVKAAKKFNFEFFIIGRNLYFIEARKNTNSLITLSPYSGLRSMDAGYDISGIVRSVEVRNIDMEEGKYLGDKKKATSKISIGNKAKPLVEKQSLVYIDPTAKNKADAGYRAQYLMDSIDYRLGSLNAEFVGVPEVVPGRFITLQGFGKPIDNDFYLTRVRHVVGNGDYRMILEGSANSVGK
ncbi:MAG: hypothetical protein K5668_10265 [Lachnospiraceae bacterium]|nr:hypothetical protein [Lachnospiraceae bacterium]